MNALEAANIQCPYCGETIDLTIDCSIPVQDYIEDCSVCCQPFNLHIDASDPNNISVIAKTDSE